LAWLRLTLYFTGTRKKNADGAIIATPDDYKAVRVIVKDIMAEGVDAAVSPGVKAVVEAVKKIVSSGKKAMTRALVVQMKLHKSNVSRHTTSAIEGGYLRNSSRGKARAAEFVLAGSLPLEAAVLPASKAVAADWRKTMGKEMAAGTAK
jgi:hypothetical protein